jgi:transitional endoplasmic reticulum ATPase
MSESSAFKLRVAEARSKDMGRAILRIDPQEMSRAVLEIGDVVEVTGKRTTVGKAMPTFKEQRGQGRVHMDGLTRVNAGAGLDEHVTLRKAEVHPASRVALAPTTINPSARDLEYIGRRLDGLPVVTGDRIRADLFGTRSTEFVVESTTPRGAVIIGPTTRLSVGREAQESARTPSYEDIGGLGSQLRRIREMIELPLRFPEVFKRLGIAPPTGVLLLGPPGCGKTLLARVIAHETEAHFITVSGPEVIHKFYGESEAHLRKIFDEAAKNAPSIVFLDEIDAIAPQREKVIGDVEKRVVATLLALLDGMNKRQQVIVIAATNIPNALDPALRRPGRFDREITIPVPDRDGREAILDIHTRGMPLAGDVDISHLASITHGFVGADLEALCREAAMNRLRHLLGDIDFALGEIPYEQLADLEVSMSDFLSALQEIEPSAIREVFVEVPDVRWTEIGGYGEVADRLREAVEWPLKHTDLFRQASVRASKGVLLHGPPGCGKTLLAKALATESQVNFISVKGPALLSKYIGESEKAVREVFHKARQAAPCIIFFDEMDALIATRSGADGGDSAVSSRVLSQVLTELDGIEELRGVFVLGATNRLDLIDEAMLRPGRFDSVIEMSLPDEVARREIFAIHLEARPLEGEPDLDRLASRSQGMSGADIASICENAAMRAIRQVVAEGGEGTVTITIADLDTALDENRKT